MLHGKNDKPEYKINISKLARYASKAQSGDKKALEYIVGATGDYIYYYCISLLRDEEEAREAVQDIYIILLNKINTLKDTGSFLGWLKAITANYCKNRLMRKNNNISFEENTEFIENIEDSDKQIIPEECIETEEIKNIIVSAVKGLPDYQRECVLMYYYCQMNIGQIAAALNIKEGTVKSRLFNARKSVKAKLEKYGRDNLTFGGFSPMAYISYSLLNDSKEYEFKINAQAVLENSGKVFAENVLDSQSALSSAVDTLAVSAVAKTALTAKVVAVTAAAGVLAAGGIAAHSIANGRPALPNSEPVSEVRQYTENVTEENIQPSGYSNELIELYYANGFTDAERRTEVLLDERAELNSYETKYYIYDRMLNSIDYFDTLQATYFYCRSSSQYSSAHYTTYCIQQGDNPKSKELVYDTEGKLVSYFICDGYKTVDIGVSGTDTTGTLDFDRSICKGIASERSKPLARELAKDNFAQMYLWDIKETRELDFASLAQSKYRKKYSQEDGQEVIYFRADALGLPTANEQYFSQSLAFDFLSDFDKWSIEETGNILGRECIVISGAADGFIDIYSFEVCADSEIGAFLSFNGYDSSGNTVLTLITDEFTVDRKIDGSLFDDLSDFVMGPQGVYVDGE